MQFWHDPNSDTTLTECEGESKLNAFDWKYVSKIIWECMDGYVVFHAPSLYGFIAKTSGLNNNTLYNLNFLYICTHRTHNVKNNNFIFHFIYFFQFTSTKKTICSCPNSTCSILNSQRGVYQEGINVDLWTDYTSLSYNQELNHEILNHKKHSVAALLRNLVCCFSTFFFRFRYENGIAAILFIQCQSKEFVCTEAASA